MGRKLRTSFLYVFLLTIFFFFSFLYQRYRRQSSFSLPAIAAASFFGSPPDHHHRLLPQPITSSLHNQAIITDEDLSPRNLPPSSSSSSLSTVSILLPDWEVLVIVSASDTPLATASDDYYFCLYPNKDVSPAIFAGFIRFPDRATFKCLLPERCRRKLPFPTPILTKNPSDPTPLRNLELLRWTYVVYDSLTTEDDVILFLKGLNNRQGFNREPSEFNCVFFRGDDVVNGVRTAVTHSMQEVFRCQRPNLTAVTSSYSGGEEEEEEEGIKISVETVQDKLVVPTVAYYNRPRKLADQSGKALLCACTMVFNVAKFLREWVSYHSQIGIEKFILYDNGSDDDLEKAVEELNNEGYNVKINVWLWQKTQEAGFSHAAVYARDSCTWMAYIDVDEFIFSPSWLDSPNPSKSMLPSLLLPDPSHNFTHPLGQISIGCHEFGPSNQTIHPVMGVTQGYNCRRHYENRHKSIVSLEAIDDSLLNVIHHFHLKTGYKTTKMNIHEMAVNHYKFQAWPEFKAKFRRRVSAYVVDWTQQVNPKSNDRAPGLGFSAVEPIGWPYKFCEVIDDGLKELTLKWFALESPSGLKMAWQRLL